MKRKCIICDQTKGKRTCIQYDKTMICPICCAQIRNSSCKSCSYYKTAEKYAEHKFRKSGGKSFIIELNEDVDRAVNEALALVERKKLTKAEKHLTELLLQYPSYHMVQYGMGTLYAFKGQIEEAISHFKKAIHAFGASERIVDAIPQVYGNLGICHAQLGRKSDALTAFDKALELNPQYEPAIVNKAMTESLAEGEKLDSKVKTVEYYKDFPMQNRSYIQYFLDEALQASDKKTNMIAANGRT